MTMHVAGTKRSQRPGGGARRVTASPAGGCGRGRADSGPAGGWDAKPAGCEPAVRPAVVVALLLALLSPAATSAVAPAVEPPLPEGPAKAPVEFPHFPDRLHAFVWRNWGLVEQERMAKVIGTSATNVEDIARSMGLPASQSVPPEMMSRGYLTLIRRNWHLLPYEQLLVLLDWTPRQLEYVLREDDFLWVKMGLLKPRCERVTYQPPTEEVSKRAGEIKRFVEREFGGELAKAGEPRFAFLRRFHRPVPDAEARAAGTKPDEGLRFIYSYFAVYGDSLSDPKLNPHPDALLKELSDLGVNGVWLHVVLRDLAPGGEAFPEFGEGHEKRLENLRALVKRAARFGVGVYLYMNEPRAMPPAFFKDRPQMLGVREGESATMCTSDPAVRRWMTDALGHVFTGVPGLAGVFTITASENLTSCASHFKESGCPRCSKRKPAEIIAEVNAIIEQGVRGANADARVIAWDWGWKDEWAGDVIARLPKSCWLQSVSEWSLPISRGGVKTEVGEYSISAVGPGPRAKRHWKLAKEAGLKTVAKMQLNCTWELSAVPYLPVTDLVASHCENLASAGVDGQMLTWTLGGYPSPNLEVARRFSVPRGTARPTKEQVLDELARNRYGQGAATHARKAWTAFSTAFGEYPYHGSVVYTCPAQFGPSNLLYLKPTGYAATMIGFPYDDVKTWAGPYGPDVFARQFEKVAEGWKAGVAELEEASRKTPPDRAEDARADLRFAKAAGLHFRSIANQARFVIARDARDAAEVRRLAEAEGAIARDLFALARDDSRIGFEASNHYYYVPLDLVEKAINCDNVLRATK
jgi:hypothetical protein